METVGFYRSIRTEPVDVVTNPTNAHKCIKVFFYYKHSIHPTRLSHSCGHPQGSA